MPKNNSGILNFIERVPGNFSGEEKSAQRRIIPPAARKLPAARPCAHHCKNEQYCGLDTIQVGTHEANPTMDQCTDCQSFKLMQ